MASPSYTYSLTNGTTADASQVMQNFNDILNGVTDGTKDLSVNAFTAAGTATLNGNVNLGNATTDVITVTGATTFSGTLAQATYNIVRLNTANGYGATNTKIRRFTNTVTNTGTAITYGDSANNGASFTINEAGIYTISYSDHFNAVSEMGLSLNSSQLTTTIESITITDILAIVSSGGTNYAAFISWTGKLAVNDVVRAHCAGIPTGATATKCHFTIAKVF